MQSIAILRAQNQSDAIPEQLLILRREFDRLERQTGISSGLTDADFTSDAFAADQAQQASAFLKECRRITFERRRAAADERRAIEENLEHSLGREGLDALKKKHTNRSIQDQALNLREMEPIGAAKDGLFHRSLPIYRIPESPFGGAHFLAGWKHLGNRLIRTWTFNQCAIYLLAALLYLALGFRVLPRLLNLPGRFRRGR